MKRNEYGTLVLPNGHLVLHEYEEAAKEILAAFSVTPTDESIALAAAPFVRIIVGREESDTAYRATAGV